MIKMTSDRILATPVVEEKTTGGLIIPETSKEKPQQATVVAIGPGRPGDRGQIIPMNVKVGDTILFTKYAGTEIKFNETDYVIMTQGDILAIVEDHPNDNNK